MTGAPTILYLHYTNPAAYPPLLHSIQLLARRGWSVRCVGANVASVSALRLPPHPRVTERLLPVRPAGWRQKIHYARFLGAALAEVRRARPDWLYVSDPIAAPAALAAARLHPGLRLLYHEHDSPDPAASMTMGQRLILRGRARLARAAALCVLPNERRLARLVAETGRRGDTACVWNCPLREEAEPPPAPAADGALRLAYVGSIVPVRLPVTLLHAMAQLPAAVMLRVIGYETQGHEGYLDHLRRTAHALGLGGRVEFLGPLPREAALQRLDGCHVGWSLWPSAGRDLNDQDMDGASNKPFDYLARGLAVLVPDQPAWQTLFVAPGYGAIARVEEAAPLAGVLRWCLDHPQEILAMGARGRQRILDEWHYERQFAPVLARLEDRHEP